MPETLRRSNDKLIAGVCSGIAEHFGWSTRATRIAYVVLSVLSAGFPGILVYVILWALMPKPNEPDVDSV